MGILNKLRFWKKKDEFNFPDLDNEFNKGFEGMKDPTSGLGGTPDLGDGMNQNNQDLFVQGPQFRSEAMGSQQSRLQQRSLQGGYPGSIPLQKDLELLSSKLDAIKALVDHINQRLENIERMQKQDQYKRW